MKEYLPHVVEYVPVHWVLDPSGSLYERFRHYVQQGVVRIITGPEFCHVVVDVRRPYYRPRFQPRLEK